VPFLLENNWSPTSPYAIPEDDMDDENIVKQGSVAFDDEEDVQLSTSPETAYLPLPSHLGWDYFKNPGIAALAAEDVQLRINQASDSLQKLWLSLGLKSSLFQTKIATAKSQYTKTRAWSAVNAVDVRVRGHAQQYRNA
jgi:hypothetical protein